MEIGYPYCFDERGRTSESNKKAHIREMIEQVLFTSPGERVNRPDFGCGLLALVFSPNSPDLAVTTQLLAQSALQKELGHLIHLSEVRVESKEEKMIINISYVIIESQEKVTEHFDYQF